MNAPLQIGRDAIAARLRYRVLLAALVCLALTMTFVSLFIGYAELDVPQAVSDALQARGSLSALVFVELRLPRALLGLLTGFSLGLAGATMQGLLRNPLAEPGIVGVSGGAALGAVIVFYSGLSGAFALALPLGGIAGAILSTMVLYGLAGRGATTTTLIERSRRRRQSRCEFQGWLRLTGRCFGLPFMRGLHEWTQFTIAWLVEIAKADRRGSAHAS